MRTVYHQIFYGYGIHKSHCNLGALASLWLNKNHQIMGLDTLKTKDSQFPCQSETDRSEGLQWDSAYSAI